METPKEKYIRESREKYLETIPERFRKIFKRAYSGKSEMAAIHAYCYRCMNFNKKDVEQCSNEECAFHEVRPRTLPPHLR